MGDYVQATVTVLSLINPMVAATIFARLEGERGQIQRRGDATKAALAIFAVLVGAALVGARLLAVFGVSMHAFSVAGGFVLAWMGFGMLRAGRSSDSEDDERSGGDEHSLSPLILFAASPGTITGVITLSVAHTGFELPVTALVAVAIAVFVTWIVLLFGGRLQQGKQGLLKDLLPKLMGLLVLSMGIQFALNGLGSFFAD